MNTWAHGYVEDLAVCNSADDSDDLHFVASPLTGGGIALAN